MKPLHHPLTSRIELIDITKAWVAISLAFAFVYSGASFINGSLNNIFEIRFLILFVISLFTAGLGFLLHELAHKFVARRYGCLAEFRASDQMLYLAVGLAAFIGFIFAAPGAVMISGMVTRKENGLISLAGPLTNYVLAGIFFAGGLLFPAVGSIFSLGLGINPWWIGFSINAWLGLFNLLPFGNFDGRKIFDWSKVIWGAMVVGGFVLLWV
ncbi:metalloprotease [Candidatus Woesearchaeota archaeon]|nr:metalloprotease [Candidatus Woesearchaeota archaeon]